MSAAKSKPRKKALKAAPAPALSPGRALTELAAGISLVEVVIHSLDGQEIAYCEQIALERTLRMFWSAHDCIDQLADSHGVDEDE